MALTKALVIEKITKRLRSPQKQSGDVVENLLSILKETLASGEDVMICNFGRFSIKEKHPRKGRNPATDQQMIVEGMRVVTFKCSGKLRDKVNR